MPSLNKVHLIGYIARDLELRYTPNNNAVTTVRLAVTRTWRPKGKEKQEETIFIDCEFFGGKAEAVCKYFKKGEPMYVGGHIRFSAWENKEHGKQSKYFIGAEEFEFLSSAGEKKKSTGLWNPPKPPPPAIPKEDIPF